MLENVIDVDIVGVWLECVEIGTEWEEESVYIINQ